VATNRINPDLSALSGRIVMMNANRDVLDSGIVYLRADRIVDVRRASQPAPDGFADVPVVATGGTVFPGLVELHNHLPYDVLGLWAVPKEYTNRDQWSAIPDYRQLITGPMAALGSDPHVVAAIIRFVELRALLGGTTTSQGVTLSSAPGIVKHFRGLVRNVEAPGEAELAAAATHIADVDAKDAEKFLARISTGQKMILHLAEGTDEAAHKHFAALHIASNRWAITENLIGIHCVGLTADDFTILAKHGGAMVWSPLSNLLLYGKTADVAAALAAGVPVALGSDWAPSGSKNLLGELKVARLAAPASVSDADLVAMATSTPAKLLGWEESLGSLQPGRIADLLVVHGTAGDPYAELLSATEADLDLVLIGGVPRIATSALMRKWGVTSGTEVLTIRRKKRLLHLPEETADPEVEALSAQAALEALRIALADLPNRLRSSAHLAAVGGVRLAVEGLVDNGMTSRPHLPYDGELTGPNLTGPKLTDAGELLAAVGQLPALKLDPLTAVDDPGYYSALAAEINLPDEIKAGLRRQSALLAVPRQARRVSGARKGSRHVSAT
jgi:cytosine/adenosine deaminase-related metal-dependent hydrolase